MGRTSQAAFNSLHVSESVIVPSFLFIQEFQSLHSWEEGTAGDFGAWGLSMLPLSVGPGDPRQNRDLSPGSHRRKGPPWTDDSIVEMLGSLLFLLSAPLGDIGSLSSLLLLRYEDL